MEQISGGASSLVPAGASGAEPLLVHSSDTGAPSPQAESVTLRALVIGLLLSLLFGAWVRQSEIVACATQITESVPAIPGIAALILLILLNPILARLGLIRPLSRGEILTIFLFVTVSLSMAGCGTGRFLLSLITAVFYFGNPINGFDKLVPHARDWLVPTDLKVIRHFYEGPAAGDAGNVPWDVWLVPILMWTLFFVLLWGTQVCILILIRRAWIENERLIFPLVFWPIEMTETHGNPRALPDFFKNRVMWTGFAISALFNIVNILHAYYPSLPEWKKFIVFGEGVRFNPPWNMMMPLVMQFRPEMIGLGFLVSTEVCFSIWFSFFLLRAGGVVMSSMGMTEQGVPYEQEQGMGSFLALTLVLLYLARTHLIPVLRYAVGLDRAPPGGGESQRFAEEDVLPYRLALFGVIAGFVGLVAFCHAAGMAAWVAVVYLALVIMVGFVYTRIRAETGAPLLWLFPFYMQKKCMLYTLGSAPFMASGGLQSLTAFAMFTFLARGYFPMMSAYQLEAFKLSSDVNLNVRHITGALLLAVVAGTLISFYQHLVPYYAEGSLTMRGGPWGYQMAISEYAAAASYAKSPLLPDHNRIVATLFGGFFTLLLSWARAHFMGFPLHPLGYAMSCSYGSLLWFPFLLVWCIKMPVVRYGGRDLYRKLVPGFLGLALGHFVVAGIIWGLLGATGKEAVLRYGVWFG
ncbi:MAG: hypothetical protein COS85_04295 [Armatimonadetes bacterium CG07_land_8_20_14_0_80_59_28]|nr:MAG: hypothetical protein COS85_04295 [Armatimonadetes bacterium CG07_land_8_20_14_0_80_59_28]